MMDTRGTKAHDQDGAVAIIVAIMFIALVGLTAFAVDYGLAYDSKRELQNSADAAALAAAATYAEHAGTCSSLVADPVKEDAARAAGLAIMEDNRPGATLIETYFGPYCQDGKLYVRWVNEGDTDAYFGGVYGAEDYTTQREATAVLGIPDGVGQGLRPFPLCSKDFQPNSPVIKVEAPNTGGPYDPDAECPEPSGNWWTANCPEDSANSTAVLAYNIEYGCDDPAIAVENPVPPPPDPAGLLAACPNDNDPADCLGSVTGNINNTTADAFRKILGKDIILPLFCGKPNCEPAALPDDGGGVAAYPIYRLVGAQICGFHFGNQDDNIPEVEDVDNPPACANSFDVTEGDNQDNYLILRFTNILVGAVYGIGDCGLGDACDGGLRAVTLFE